MKVILTGSLGHIGKPLATALVQKGHAVTVISSDANKQAAIQALGATAAIGSLTDADFVTAIFNGADVVYCMVPPSNYFDHNLDLIDFYHTIAQNYAQAIKASGIKRAVYLSSIGADLAEGNGIIVGHYDGEATMNQLHDVDISFIRPTSFYYNLYGYIPAIKNMGAIMANYGGDDVIPWVSPIDIAAVIVEEIEAPQKGKNIRYVASQELTCSQTATILGEAIGMPDLKWEVVSGQQVLDSLLAIGMNPRIAAGLVEMYACLHSGLFAKDYFNNRPAVMGNVKLTDFSREFATAFKIN